MYGGWKPSGRTQLYSWTNPTIWEYWEQNHPNATGRQIILPKSPRGALVDNCRTKRVKIAKVSLFDNITV